MRVCTHSAESAGRMEIGERWELQRHKRNRTTWLEYHLHLLNQETHTQNNTQPLSHGTTLDGHIVI